MLIAANIRIAVFNEESKKGQNNHLMTDKDNNADVDVTSLLSKNPAVSAPSTPMKGQNRELFNEFRILSNLYYDHSICGLNCNIGEVWLDAKSRLFIDRLARRGLGFKKKMWRKNHGKTPGLSETPNSDDTGTRQDDDGDVHRHYIPALSREEQEGFGEPNISGRRWSPNHERKRLEAHARKEAEIIANGKNTRFNDVCHPSKKKSRRLPGACHYSMTQGDVEYANTNENMSSIPLDNPSILTHSAYKELKLKKAHIRCRQAHILSISPKNSGNHDPGNESKSPIASMNARVLTRQDILLSSRKSPLSPADISRWNTRSKSQNEMLDEQVFRAASNDSTLQNQGYRKLQPSKVMSPSEDESSISVIFFIISIYFY